MRTPALARVCILLALQSLAAAAQAQSVPNWYTLPTQADEQATYDNVLHWTWTASDKAVEFASSYGGPSGSGFDVHGSSEGDDLWTHYQMYLRTGNARYRTWAQGWRNYFVNHYLADLRSSCGTGFLYDHAYGWGLILWAHYENDPAALAAAEAIGAQIESYRSNVNPGSTAIAYWGSRSYARHTILAIYLAQETGAQRWITLRDKLLDGLVRSPDWRAGAVGGNYFVSRDQMAAGGSSASAYDGGRRLNSAFQYALHTEALWRGYLATGRADIRDKLVDIARWTEYYAHDPSYVNPMVGAWFGQNNGDLSRWHRDSDSGSSNLNGSDPVYETSLVNTMVIGYKLTGSPSMLAMARTLFRKGTLWPPGYRQQKHVADNEVHHYVDTLTNPDQFLFEYNKGELQYTYLLFENGGNPTVLGPTPSAPTNLTVQ